MKAVFQRAALCSIVFLSLSGLSPQAAVTFVGNDIVTGSAWRTPSVVKTNDVDGDNVYGSAGYFLPSSKFFRYRNPLTTGTGAIVPDPQGINALPGYITGLQFADAEPGASWGGEFADCGTLDQVPGSLGLTGAGILPSVAGTNVLNLTLKRSSSPAFRLTLIFGNNPNALTFFETSAVSEDTTVANNAGIPNNDDALGMHVTVNDGSGAVSRLSGDPSLSTNTTGYTTFQSWDIPAGSSDINITIDVTGTTNTIPRLSGVAIDSLPITLPTVLIPPVGGTVYSGNPIVLDVTAGGTGIGYQWLKNSNSIAGATNWEFKILSATTNDTGNYQAVITNSIGSVTSIVAAVTVLAPPVTILLQDTLSNGVAGSLNGRTPDTVGTSNWLAGTGWSTDGSEAAGTGTGNAFLPFVPQLGRIYSLSADIEDTTTDGGSWTALGFANGTTLNSQWHTVNSPVGWWLARGDYPAGNASNPNQTFIGPGTGSGSTGAGFWASNMVTYKVILDTTASSPANWTFTYLANGNVIRAATAFGGSGPTITRVGVGMINANGTSIVRNFILSQQIPFSAPFFSTQPVGGTNFVGETKTFSVVVGGSDPLTFQWQKNSNNIANATNSFLTLTNIQTTDSGSYRVVVMNPLLPGGTNSSNATVTVVAPVVSTIYKDTFSYVTNLLDGSIPDTTGSAAWRADPSWSSDGTEASVNSSASANAYLPFVPEAGNVYTLSANVDCFSGSWLALGFANAATTGINWQNSPNNPVGWSLVRPDGFGQNNQVFIGPGTGGGLDTGFAPVGGTHNYSVILDTRPISKSAWTFTFLMDSNVVAGPTAFGGSGPSISTVGMGAFAISQGIVNTFILTVASVSNAAPVVLTQPTGGTFLVGSQTTLSAYAGGTGPLTYQWQKNSTNISGATSTQLIFTNLAVTDSGNYQLIVSNSVGFATSSNVLITVVTNLPIVTTNFDAGDVLPGLPVDTSHDLILSSLASVSPVASGNNFTGLNMRNGTTGTAHENSTDNPANVMNAGTNDFVFDTSVNTAGYDITSVVTYSGWTDRAGQNHTVYYRQVGSANFVPLGTVVNTAPGDGSLRMAVTNIYGGVLATGVNAIRIVVNQTFFVYREIEVDGTPSTISTVVSPTLTIAPQTGSVLVSWPASATGFGLTESAALGTGASWQAVGGSPTVVNGTNQIIIPTTNSVQFFRLVK